MNVIDVAPQAVALLGIFATVSLVTYLIFHWWDPYWRDVQGRLAELSQDEDGDSVDWAEHDSGVNRDGKSDRVRPGLRSWLTAAPMMEAGIHHRGMWFFLSTLRCLLLVVPPFALGACYWAGKLPMQHAFCVAAILMTVGYAAPILWLRRTSRQFHRMLRNALPDFLDLMVVCLDAGLSLQESIQRVGQELQWIHPDFATQISMVQQDIELGSPVERALRRFADRTNDDALRTLSSLVREGQRFGTNISEALRGHSDMLRFQREQAAEENAQKASVKIILPTMLFIFPAIFIVLVSPAAFKIQEAFAGQ
ncbi:type II secretion system F family protein [Rhodopirellula halodulae]|uniref:type II secretion system F family protein n=1 Tax=Rhodopirellula halodulae TaxID=2894198 RepID=UPI001E4EB331|nr:type II secretion system F family protein [Rhodopirellula sp. JC737]MCC9655255.1 type II secretion system F family protein [Rhodopirellula sp. JC737]